jgi:hypothetical protein
MRRWTWNARARGMGPDLANFNGEDGFHSIRRAALSNSDNSSKSAFTSNSIRPIPLEVGNAGYRCARPHINEVRVQADLSLKRDIVISSKR